MLNNIMVDAYQQNLTLREAGFRILAARRNIGIAVGNLFPQQQGASGGYVRRAVQNIYSESWDLGFNLAWELDFWGRYRRAILASEATLDASVFNYDDVLVTLLGDVASTYVQIRTIQRRIELLENVIAVQEDVYDFIDLRLREGFAGVTELDKAQAESDLKQSQAQIAQFRIDLRTTENALCALLGRPSVDLEPWLNSGPRRGIPIPPDYVVVGIPADLLRRRPDVRRAERNAASQAEQIGIATTDLYPAFTITGSLGWQNSQLDQLIMPGSFTGCVGPQFQWNLLNYGRLLNNIRLQDARFNELVAFYQNTVVNASAEAENGIVTFLQAQDRARLLGESVNASYRALAVIVAQYEEGRGRAGRLQSIRGDSAVAHHAAGSVGPVARSDRSGNDPDLPRAGRWLGDSPRRQRECVPRSAAGHQHSRLPARRSTAAGGRGRTNARGPEPSRCGRRSGRTRASSARAGRRSARAAGLAGSRRCSC